MEVLGISFFSICDIYYKTKIKFWSTIQKKILSWHIFFYTKTIFWNTGKIPFVQGRKKFLSRKFLTAYKNCIFIYTIKSLCRSVDQRNWELRECRRILTFVPCSKKGSQLFPGLTWIRVFLPVYQLVMHVSVSPSVNWIFPQIFQISWHLKTNLILVHHHHITMSIRQ